MSDRRGRSRGVCIGYAIGNCLRIFRDMDIGVYGYIWIYGYMDMDIWIDDITARTNCSRKRVGVRYRYNLGPSRRWSWKWKDHHRCAERLLIPVLVRHDHRKSC